MSGWRIAETAVEFSPTSFKAAVVASFKLVFICDFNACIIAGKVGIDPVPFPSVTEVPGTAEALLGEKVYGLVVKFELPCKVVVCIDRM
jgi:hypothetical protein